MGRAESSSPDDSQVFFAGAEVRGGQQTLDLLLKDVSEEGGAPGGGDPSEGANSSEPLKIPAKLGSYQIAGEIARGGMGLVLRGHHELLSRDVAIKLLLPKASGDHQCLQRFLLEAKATARLRHPGIVAIHDVAEDEEGTPYLVMDYIGGQTLRERIRERGALPPGEVAEVLSVVASAVAHAHEEGILHRDLKPDNVLVDERGRPHLTDFGLAKLVQGEAPAESSPSGRLVAGSEVQAGLTNAGVVMGTPRYMSPEQVRGHAATRAVDVWALGAMLYEALTGKPPFPGKTVMEIFEGILKREPTPPSVLNPLIPARLDRICLRCLSKEPADRPESASAVARELRLELEAARRPIRTAAPRPSVVDTSGFVGFAKVGAVILALLSVPVVFGPGRSLWADAGPSSQATPQLGSSTTPLSPGVAANKAQSLQEQAAAGEPAAMSRWGQRLLLSGEDPPAGLALLERAAEAGEVSACLALGRAYQEGLGVEQDIQSATQWFREGAKGGQAVCAVAAGLILARDAEEESRLEARQLLEAGLPGLKSAGESRVCLTVLGRLYIQVEPASPERGMECLERAAAQGSTAAMVDLCRLLESGEVVAPDSEAAYAYLRKATARGDVVAWVELGDVLASGRLGQERSPDAARAAYEHARQKLPDVVQARLERLSE